MKTFKTLGTLARYFKTQQPGATAVLTGGPVTCRVATGHIKQRGVVITLSGQHGNRLATFIRLEEVAVQTLKDYQASKAMGAEHLLGNKMDQLLPGASVYIEGNNKTIARDLTRKGYKGRYSLQKQGSGWMLTIRAV